MQDQPLKMETIRTRAENSLPLIFDSQLNIGIYKCVFNFPKTKEPPAWVQISLSYLTCNEQNIKLGELKRKSRFFIYSTHPPGFYTDTFFKAVQEEDQLFRKLFNEYGLINYPADVFPYISMEMFRNAIEDTYGQGQLPW